MIKKLFIIFLICVLFVMPVVANEQVTIQVDSKHIEGYGTGNSPMEVDDYCRPMYLISDRSYNGYCTYIVEEYPISYMDYFKIKTGQTVTLECPENGVCVCKVVEVR